MMQSNGCSAMFFAFLRFAVYGTAVQADSIKEIKKEGPYFRVIGMKQECVAKFVLLATGVIDIEPSLPNLTECVRKGLIKHCSICDAYEAINTKIGVIGNGNKGIKEALFLRNYSPDITLLTLGDTEITSKKKVDDLQKAGIKLVQDPIHEVLLNEIGIHALITQSGEELLFDTIYSSLGSVVRFGLATQLGAKNINNYLLVSDHQETSIKGLFAVGDIVLGLNQICVATGHGAIAATQIHNRLDTFGKK